MRNPNRKVFHLLAALGAWAASMAVGPKAAAADTTHSPEIRIMRLAGGVRYGVMGKLDGHPAPTLFAFEGDIETAQREPVYTEVSRILAAHGFLSIILDVPAHGEDHRPGEAPELAGWRQRVDRGEDLVGPFVRNASKVLDYLIGAGYCDPAKIGAYGTSRGGFMAFQFAASDARVGLAAGISPVTDLRALREFKGTALEGNAEKLSLIHLAPRLAGRPMWVSIGNHDARVGTDRAIAFTRALVSVSAQGKNDNAVIPVDLLVGPTPGHRKIDDASELLATWILRRFKLP